MSADPYARYVRVQFGAVTHLAQPYGKGPLCGEDIPDFMTFSPMRITFPNTVCAYAWPVCPDCARVAE